MVILPQWGVYASTCQPLPIIWELFWADKTGKTTAAAIAVKLHQRLTKGGHLIVDPFCRFSLAWDYPTCVMPP
jgi:hypothetical protein